MKGAKSSIIQAIGDTPIVRLDRKFTGVDCEIYLKLEYLNPGGSTKDRIGIYMIEQAIKQGLLSPGGTIIEGTSGNTGVGIAMYGAIHGYPCVFVTNDKQSSDKIDNLRAYGAQVVVCPTEVSPDDPRSYYSVSKRLAQTIPNAYYVNQYDNLWNRETHYCTTAPEIHRQTDGEFNVFVAAVGTGGTISGCGRYFKQHCPHIKIVGVDCQGSIIAHYWKTGEISTAHSYVLEGIGEDFIPENYDFKVIDDFMVVEDGESFLMTRKLLSRQAIYCGGSSGAAVLAAIRYARQLDSSQKILVLLHDSGNRYSSKIFNNDWMTKHGYWQGCFSGSIKEMREELGKTGPLTVADTSLSIAQVLELMEKTPYPVIPVVSDRGVVGVVRNDELMGPLFDQILSPGDNITTVCSQNFVQIEQSQPVQKAVDALRDNQSVIVCSNNQPQDIITQGDILKLAKAN